MSESIGIIAGSGQFPRLVAEDAKAAGYGVVVCAFHGFTDPGLEALADAYTTVYLGQFDKVIDYFRKHGVRRLCMAGAINKPRALDLRPDFRAARILFSLRGKGDDALLRAIMADLEKEGFTLIQAAELSTSLLCPEGVLTRRGPSAEEIAEIDYGWPIAEALGRFDIGQCIVVKQGMVVAVECLEGTDAALRRAIRGLQSTTFLVSQRIACVRQADSILVLDNGRLAGWGDHDTLMKTCPVYQEIYWSQFPEERPQGKEVQA